MESQLPKLLAEKKLYVHPPAKGTKPKYSRQPAAPGPYLDKLQKEIDALAAKLAPAGITREQIVAALQGERPAIDLSHRIEEYLKTKPGGVSLPRMREDLGLTPACKSSFDHAVLSLFRQHRVYLDQHDYPASLDDAARNQLVSDDSGNYFVVIGLRVPDAESIP